MKNLVKRNFPYIVFGLGFLFFLLTIAYAVDQYPKQVGIGSYPGDPTASDSVYSGFKKVNENFTDIYGRITNATATNWYVTTNVTITTNRYVTNIYPTTNFYSTNFLYVTNISYTTNYYTTNIVTYTNTYNITNNIGAGGSNQYLDGTRAFKNVDARYITNLPYIDVRAYGAVGDGVTDDTLALQIALDAAQTKSNVVYFPAGIYLVTSQLSVSNHYVRLMGVGIGRSFIRFVPTTNAVCMLFRGPPDQTLVGGGISHMSFVSPNTSWVKTAIKVDNVEEWACEYVSVGFGGQTWHDTNQLSIGLHICGRQFIRVYKTDVVCDRPIVIDRNPYRAAMANIDLDQSRFTDMLLYPHDKITRPNIEIMDGVNIYNSLISDMSWTLGGWGLRWIDTTGTNDSVSLQLEIARIRWEQSTNSAGYCIQIEKDSDLRDLKIDSVYGGYKTRGYKFRNIDGLMLNRVQFAGTNDMSLDVDTTVKNLTLNNCFWQAGSTGSLGGLRTSIADKPYTGGVPSNARYDHRTPANPLQLGDWTVDNTNRNIGVGTTNPTAGVTVVEDAVMSQSADWSTGVVGHSIWTRLGGSGTNRYGRIDVYRDGGNSLSMLKLQPGNGQVMVGTNDVSVYKFTVAGSLGADTMYQGGYAVLDTRYSETDPVFGASVASGISPGLTNYWAGDQLDNADTLVKRGFLGVITNTHYRSTSHFIMTAPTGGNIIMHPDESSGSGRVTVDGNLYVSSFITVPGTAVFGGPVLSSNGFSVAGGTLGETMNVQVSIPGGTATLIFVGGIFTGTNQP